MVMPTVNAACGYNEKSRLQALASNVNFSYNYQENGGGIDSSVDFSITITNITPELYVVDQTNIKVYNHNSNNDITVNGYSPGSTIQFIVYGNTENCLGTELITNYVTLPSYNRFYKDPICDGLVGYKLCNRWTKADLSYDEFVKKVKQYKEQIKVDDNPSHDDENDIIEMVIDFLSKYSFYLFGGIIFVCSFTIFYLRRKDDFDLN